MTYVIYPVDEKRWVKIWRSIRNLCKTQKMQIVEVDVQTFGEYLDTKKKNAKFRDLSHLTMGFRDDQPVTIIKLAGQASLVLE